VGAAVCAGRARFAAEAATPNTRWFRHCGPRPIIEGVTQYVPVDIELRRISPAKLRVALGLALLLVVALDVAELVQSLG
jgi:hypothetical protein